MHVKPYYTIHPSFLSVLHGQQPAMVENAHLNLFFKDEESFTPALFARVNSIKPDYIFSISTSLLNNTAMLNNILPRLYLLKSLIPGANGDLLTIPVISEKSEIADLQNAEMMAAYFRNQGISQVSIPFFSYTHLEASVQHADGYSFFMYPQASDQIESRFSDFKEKAATYSSPVIIGFEDEITGLDPFHEVIRRTMAALQTSAMTPDYVQENYIDKKTYEEEKQLWKKRASLYQEFLQISKSVQEKEYYEILSWYRQEYESLPLWYKRFGHVVKVFTGKRRFGSLFNDKVKKYKD
jgi:hypothetical protein